MKCYKLIWMQQNAIYQVDTLQSEVTETVNNIPPGGSGLVSAANYVVSTLVRNGMIQHADSGAILDGVSVPLFVCFAASLHTR